MAATSAATAAFEMLGAEVETPLTEIEARARAARVSFVNYSLRLELGTGATVSDVGGGWRVCISREPHAPPPPALCVCVCVCARAQYTGSARVSFNLSKGDDAAAGLFLDFTGRSIRRARVNGGAVGAGAWRAQRLHLDAALLRDGANVVEVDYTNAYDHTGEPRRACRGRGS